MARPAAEARFIPLQASAGAHLNSFFTLSIINSRANLRASIIETFQLVSVEAISASVNIHGVFTDSLPDISRSHGGLASH